MPGTYMFTTGGHEPRYALGGLRLHPRPPGARCRAALHSVAVVISASRAGVVASSCAATCHARRRASACGRPARPAPNLGRRSARVITTSAGRFPEQPRELLRQVGPQQHRVPLREGHRLHGVHPQVRGCSVRRWLLCPCQSTAAACVQLRCLAHATRLEPHPTQASNSTPARTRGNDPGSPLTTPA